MRSRRGNSPGDASLRGKDFGSRNEQGGGRGCMGEVRRFDICQGKRKNLAMVRECRNSVRLFR